MLRAACLVASWLALSASAWAASGDVWSLKLTATGNGTVTQVYTVPASTVLQLRAVNVSSTTNTAEQAMVNGAILASGTQVSIPVVMDLKGPQDVIFAATGKSSVSFMGVLAPGPDDTIAGIAAADALYLAKAVDGLVNLSFALVAMGWALRFVRRFI